MWLVLLIVVLVLFHAGWYLVTRSKLYAPLPEEATITRFQRDLLDRMNIHVDQGVIEEARLESAGNRLRLTILPAGEGAPVLVFIPGTAVYAFTYIELLYALYRRDITVVGFDPRGHGQSGGPRGDYTINGIVDDALAVVAYARQRFGGEVAVGGSSQGGLAAFYAAARDSSLAAAVCHNIADLNGRDNLRLSRLKIPAGLVPVNQMLLKLYGGFAVPVSLYLDLSREILKDGTDAATYVKEDPLCVNWITLRALGSLMKTELARPVNSIEVPVMLIHSDRDNIFPRDYVEDIFNRLTCPKEYLLLSDRDHLVMTNHVDEVAGPIADWLQQIGPVQQPGPDS
ncbi:MAG: alpha/beta hydrolase [Desulfosudaceae bacterium]